MMVLLELFWSFTKIGFTSFGGFSMIPLISSEMLSHQWMTVDEISNIVAIAEMTPGPLGLNCASYAGIRTAGPLGAVAANLGILMPTFTVVMLVGVFFLKFKESRQVKHIMIGIRPACIGMIAGVMVTLSATNYLQGNTVSLAAIGIGLFDMLLLRWKRTVPQIIVISAVLGALLFGVLGLR